MGKLTVINAADILTGPELPLSLEGDYEEQAYRRGINHAICIASDLVRAGALHGVSAAREAYRRRDPVHADLDLGSVVDPAEQAAPRSIAEVRRLARQLLTDYERRQQHKMRAQNG